MKNFSFSAFFKMAFVGRQPIRISAFGTTFNKLFFDLSFRKKISILFQDFKLLIR